MDLLLKKILLFLGNRTNAQDFDIKASHSFLIRPIGGGIGDAVVLTHFIRNLKKAYPKADIYVMPSARNVSVFCGNPYITKVYPYSLLSFIKLRGKVDTFIDFTTYIKVKNFISYIILGQKATVTAFRHSKCGLTEKDFSYYRLYTPTDMEKPYIKVFLDLASALHLSDDSFGYDLYPSAPALEQAEAFWEKGKRKILLNLFGTSKELSRGESASLINKIRAEFKNADIALLWDKHTEREAASFAALCGARLCPRTTVEDVFALCSSSDFIISVDTATVHIAAALKKPLLAFFEKNIYAQWMPPGDNNDIIFCSIKPAKERAEYCFDYKEAFALAYSRLKNIA
jgi:ADP-heptose:LPS heptosyltransferase